MDDKVLLDAYYYHLRSNNVTPDTLKCHVERMGYLLRYARGIGKPLLILTEADIRAYFVGIIDKVKPITINGRRKYWNQFFEFCREQQLTPDGWVNPLDKIKKHKEIQRSFRLLTPTEYSKMVKWYKPRTYPGLRNQVMMLLAWDCMLRVSELIGLKVEDVGMKPDKVIKIHGKGRKIRYLSFSDKTALKLTIYIAQYEKKMKGGYLFLTEHGDKITKRYCYDIFDRARINTGLPMKVGVHLVRRSSATDYWRKTGNIYSVRDILGHSRLSVTETYVQSDMTDIVRQYEKTAPADALNI